jgi:hypothetical protein
VVSIVFDEEPLEVWLWVLDRDGRVTFQQRCERVEGSSPPILRGTALCPGRLHESHFLALSSHRAPRHLLPAEAERKKAEADAREARELLDAIAASTRHTDSVRWARRAGNYFRSCAEHWKGEQLQDFPRAALAWHYSVLCFQRADTDSTFQRQMLDALSPEQRGWAEPWLAITDLGSVPVEQLAKVVGPALERWAFDQLPVITLDPEEPTDSIVRALAVINSAGADLNAQRNALRASLSLAEFSLSCGFTEMAHKLFGRVTRQQGLLDPDTLVKARILRDRLMEADNDAG